MIACFGECELQAFRSAPICKAFHGFEVPFRLRALARCLFKDPRILSVETVDHRKKAALRSSGAMRRCRPTSSQRCWDLAHAPRVYVGCSLSSGARFLAHYTESGYIYILYIYMYVYVYVYIYVYIYISTHGTLTCRCRRRCDCRCRCSSGCRCIPQMNACECVSMYLPMSMYMHVDVCMYVMRISPEISKSTIA